MILTEEEAKTKWCPYSQVSAAASGEQSGEWYNRAWAMLERIFKKDRPYDEAFNCLASECMAWRKAHDREYDKHGNVPGYCGLSGKPND